MATEQHDRRREEIIRTAQHLFFSNGYENTSVAQIIDAVGIAKGTFYHYFATKDELLAELVEFRIQDIMHHLDEIVTDVTLTGREKLARYFHDAGVWKADNRELMMQALFVLYREENEVLMQRMTRRSIEAVTPALARMIREGTEQGAFSVDDPEICAEYLFGAWAAVGEIASRIILAAPDSPVAIGELERRLEFNELAMNRVLATRGEPIRFYSREALARLFARDEAPQEEAHD